MDNKNTQPKTNFIRSCKHLLALLLLVTTQVQANYVNHKLQGQKLSIQLQNGSVTLTPRNALAIEAHYTKAGVKQLPSFALLPDTHKVDVSLQDKGETLLFATPELTAEIHKQPFSIRYLYQGKPLVSEEKGFFAEDTIRGFRFKLDETEELMGAGERVLGMDRRGHRLPLYNRAHYGYGTESSQMYFSMPMVMSSKGYMLLFDNSASGFVDLGKTEKDILQFEAAGGRTAYVVFAGKDTPELLNSYVNATGKQPMPPRWALGNYASRFGYHNEQEVRDTVQRFIQQDFPLDAIVLDLYWFGPDIQGHMGNLDWDREAFPNPEKMIADLREQGVKTVVITEPFILTTSAKWQDAVNNNALATNLGGKPKRFDFYFGNTGLVDVFNADGRDWFNQSYQMLFDQGVAGWWGDLGEPEVHPADSIHRLDDGTSVTAEEIHNAYGHQWAKMVFEKQLQMAPELRPFIMMRAGFAGSQRYGMIPWTGDVSRSWDGLKPQVELSLQMGLQGMAYTHSDLGGFAGGEEFDPELYIRWLQYGVFQPVFRPHAQENIAPEPVFHDQSVQDVLRPYVKLRYQLIPYNYTLAYENSTSGIPLMRPLFFTDNTKAYRENTSTYLWGDAFLVTPVTSPGVTEQKVTLPEGVWFDFWNGNKYQGNQQLDIPVTLNTIPVMVKAGSFIPMTDSVQSTESYSSQKLNLHYYADPSVSSAQGQMYEDDGLSADSLKENAFELLQFNAVHSDTQLTLNLKREGEGYEGMPEHREMVLTVHHLSHKPEKIMLNGKAMKLGKDAVWLKDNRLQLHFNWDHQPLTVAIK